MTDNTVLAASAALTAIIIQGLKKINKDISSEILPVISILTGAAINALYQAFTTNFTPESLLNALFNSVISGLAASGGYDAVRSVVNFNKGGNIN